MDRIPVNSFAKDKGNSKTVFLIQAISIALAVILAVAILFKNWNFFHDDAYITLRYAKNWITGHGIVWNEGEYVQGYTNFLHLLCVYILGYFGLDLVVAARLVSSAAFLATAILLAYCGYSFRLGYSKNFQHLPIIIFITSAPVIVWTLGGLETVLFGFLTLLGTVIFLSAVGKNYVNRRFLLSGAFFGLAFLTRPDAIVFIGASSIYLFCYYRKSLNQKVAFVSHVAPGTVVYSRKQLASSLIILWLGCAFIMLPYICWQINYYGDFVPNTFYAKSGAPFLLKFNNGINYIYDYFTHFPFLLLIISLLLFYSFYRSSLDYRLIYLGTLIFSYLAFIIFVAGGDHMQSFRMIASLVPLISITLTCSIASLVENNINNVLIISFCLIFLTGMQLFEPILNPQEEDLAAFYGTIVGKYISSEWHHDSLIALNTAGSTPYYAPSHRFIDMLGLNDPVVARRFVSKAILPWQRIPGHLKGDGDYVFSRNPNFIIIGPADGSDSGNAWFLSDYELIKNPHFHLNYELNKVFLDKKGKVCEKPELPFEYLSGSNHKQKYSKPCFLFRYFKKRVASTK